MEPAMKKITWKFICILPVLFLLNSCSDGKRLVNLNLKYLPSDQVPAHVVDVHSQEQIAEAATAIGQSLQELSAVQMTVHPPKKIQKPYDSRVIGMGKLASIHWTGPVEPVLKRLSKRPITNSV